MNTSFTRHVYAALIGIALLSSCGRPVAYFQKSPATSYALANTQKISVAAPVQTNAFPEASLPQVNEASNPVDAYVRNDRNGVVNKSLAKRLGRMKQLLAATPEQPATALSTAPRKMSRVDRLIIKKINKQIGRQLAPAQPDKAMVAGRAQLIGGAVLLIGGLILLILGTGTAAFIGLILSLIGAVGVIVGLFGG